MEVNHTYALFCFTNKGNLLIITTILWNIVKIIESNGRLMLLRVPKNNFIVITAE